MKKRAFLLLGLCSAALLIANVSYADSSPPASESKTVVVHDAVPTIEVVAYELTDLSIQMAYKLKEDINASASVTAYEKPQASVLPIAPVTSFSEFRDRLLPLAHTGLKHTAFGNRTKTPAIYPELGYGLANRR